MIEVLAETIQEHVENADLSNKERHGESAPWAITMVYLAFRMGVKYQLSNFQPALDIFIAFLGRQSMEWNIAGELNPTFYANRF